MKNLIILGCILFAPSTFAQCEEYKTTVREVTEEYLQDENPTKIDLDKLIELGGKIWEYLLNNQPDVKYEPLRTSIVPEGITSWSQLQNWAQPVSKVFRVEFTNALGGSGGGFDYRISYVPGGSYQGRGKFIGQLGINPTNVNVRTGRKLKLKAELVNILNFGTETDPVAGAHVMITWDSPTLTRYEMNSKEYYVFGTGELQDLNGNL